ncbi:MAG: hypothetical protein JXB39_09860 [Deltaproteobacteria bacterium]|nr:hypothetical protein [Deltaproteobacteria bacterium]
MAPSEPPDEETPNLDTAAANGKGSAEPGGKGNAGPGGKGNAGPGGKGRVGPGGKGLGWTELGLLAQQVESCPVDDARETLEGAPAGP